MRRAVFFSLGILLSVAVAKAEPPPVPGPTSHLPDPSVKRKPAREYPWHTDITTTVFWMEIAAPVSSGIPAPPPGKDASSNWAAAPGGDLVPPSVYQDGSREKTATNNPFYAALPFNDLAYPDQAARWLPAGWSKPPKRNGLPQSSCKGRWIEMKTVAGRVCFAQWEDVGPIVTDDVDYVFGSRRPKASRGLDVSPLVAKYLGIDSTAQLSWRFVDDEDVLPGRWLPYVEQAIQFGNGKELSHPPTHKP